MDLTQLSDDDFSARLEAMNEREAKLIADIKAERADLDRENRRRQRSAQYAFVAEALEELATAWEANFEALGREPDTYPEYGKGAEFHFKTNPALRGPHMLKTQAALWPDSREDIDDEDREDRDGPRYMALQLDCGPGKHFCVRALFYDLDYKDQARFIEDHGAWYATGGIPGHEQIAQLRELAAAAADELWMPYHDDRPRTDEQGRKLYDHYGRKYLFNDEGKPYPNNMYDMILGKPEDFA